MKQSVVAALSITAFLCTAVLVPALHAQATFEQTVADIQSEDAAVRLQAARMLKDAAYLEAAVPLATLVGDADNDVRLEAIAAELHIFLADQSSAGRHPAYVSVRGRIAAESAFAAGAAALGPHPVPMEVLTALSAASHAEAPGVAPEAIYAFGTLAANAAPGSRRQVLHVSGGDLAPLVGAADPAVRLAAVRVLGRVDAWQAGDDPVDQTVGDAVVSALNDKGLAVRLAAMDALGAMRYARGVHALSDLASFYNGRTGSATALDALAHIQHPSSAPVFLAALKSHNAATRVIAIEGLARLGDPEHADAIQAVTLGESSDAVLLAVKFSDVLLSGGSLDPIAEMLTRPRLHDQALQYLIELGPGHVAMFSRVAQDPDARLRSGAAEALGRSSDARALAIIEPLLRDRDADVTRAATLAVTRLRGVRQPS